jgi:hypothetical protein
MKKTGGIVATVLTSLLLGIPGFVIAIIGIIAALGTRIPAVVAQSEYSNKDVQLGAITFIAGGLIMMLIPLIVGITTLRKKRAPAPAPAPETPVVPVFASPAVVQEPTPVPPVSVPPQPNPQPVAIPPSVVAAPMPPSNPGAEVLSRLMALNRPTAPYHIIDGKSEGVDVIAEWKIVDAQWKEIFAKASLKKEYRIYLKLDPAKHEVRAMDREISIETHTGFPSLKGEVSVFKGQQTSFSIGTGYAFTETLATGQVYKYRFNSNELKKPIQEAIASCGWKYKPVAFGKL